MLRPYWKLWWGGVLVFVVGIGGGSAFSDNPPHDPSPAFKCTRPAPRKSEVEVFLVVLMMLSVEGAVVAAAIVEVVAVWSAGVRGGYWRWWRVLAISFPALAPVLTLSAHRARHSAVGMCGGGGVGGGGRGGERSSVTSHPHLPVDAERPAPIPAPSPNSCAVQATAASPARSAFNIRVQLLPSQRTVEQGDIGRGCGGVGGSGRGRVTGGG